MPYLDKLCPSVNLAALIRGVRRRRRALSLLRCITSFGAGGTLCCVPSTEVCHVDLVWTHHCVEEPSFDNIERSATLSSSSQPTIDRLNRRKAYRRQAFVPFFSTSAAKSCHVLEASRVNSKRQAGLKGNTGGLRTSRPSWSWGKETIGIRDMRIVDQTHIALFREHVFSRIFSFIICRVNTWERRHFLMR